MAYQLDLNWDQARALLHEGAMVRRIGWTDRWIYMAGVWEYMLYNTGEKHVVRAPEFGIAEFAASDWTTLWPDQWRCVYPDPEVPPVDPQPEAGGPIKQLYQFGVENSPKSSARVGEKEIHNPIAGPAQVWLHGRADDRFRLKLTSGWFEAWTPSPSWDYPANVDIRFILGAGQTFSIAASNEGGGVCKYDVTGEFTL